MKKLYLPFIIVLIILLIFGHYYNEVRKARKETPVIIARELNSNKMVLEVSDLSARQVEILLKVEDPNFYNHKGIDPRTLGAGLTTITQSLVKIFYYDKFKPGLAKIRQTLIARFALNPLVSKDDQLKLFINEMFLGKCAGKPVYGFASACSLYYEKPFSEIGEDEYISLVAMLIVPTTFNLKDYPERNLNRVESIKRMLSGEYKLKGHMDLYYGGESYREPRSKVKGWYNRIVWGY